MPGDQRTQTTDELERERLLAGELQRAKAKIFPLQNHLTVRLTRRQQEILDYLRDHAEQLAHPPTLDELCAMLGLRSRGSLHKHVQALVNAGYVEPMDGRHRGIRLTPQEPMAETGFDD